MASVIIQSGHCFRTTGATGTSGVDADPTEQEFAHMAANMAVALVGNAGHSARAILADVPDSAYGPADLFVAIHCDGSISGSAGGASVGYRTNMGADAAARWKANYHEAGWSGGWRPDNYTPALAGYYGVREAVAAGTWRSFIVECGFLTNPQNEALLSFPEGPERFARALTDTVIELFGGTTPPPAAVPVPAAFGGFSIVSLTSQPSSTWVNLVIVGQDNQAYHYTAPNVEGLAGAPKEALGGSVREVTAAWSGHDTLIVTGVGAEDDLMYTKFWRGGVWSDWFNAPTDGLVGPAPPPPPPDE